MFTSSDRGRGAAEDHLVEFVGANALPDEQRAAGLGGEVGRRERPGPVLRFRNGVRAPSTT